MRYGRFVAVAAVAGLVLVGCGEAAEKATEELIERGSGGDVNIEEGGMSFESEDGSFSVDDEGNVQMESEDGSFSMDTGSGELAEGFPEVPLPEDADLVTSGKVTSDGETSYSATFETSGDAADLYAEMKDIYESAGYAIEDESTTEGDGTFLGNTSFIGDELSVFMTVMADSESSMMSFQVHPTQP